jgi:hypothetical protein
MSFGAPFQDEPRFVGQQTMEQDPNIIRRQSFVFSFHDLSAKDSLDESSFGIDPREKRVKIFFSNPSQPTDSMHQPSSPIRRNHHIH